MRRSRTIPDIRHTSVGYLSPTLAFSATMTSIDPANNHEDDDTRSSPTFGLVIGINEYQTYDHLEGAVADADAFSRFLVETLGTNESHIINLRDKAATKAAITSAFESLTSHPKINNGDAIIIYFSGHGARAPVPADWDGWASNDSKIEMICPVDIGATASTDVNPISGIPDRTIGVWLNQLSKEKGDNITLVLDCCHSAGASRDQTEPAFVARRIINAPPISLCDRKIWSDNAEMVNARGATVATGFAGQNEESHILLAACGRDEIAWEDPRTKRGLFTTALLNALAECEIHDTTYLSLIQSIQIPSGPGQVPHCYGRHSNRRLFNKRATRSHQTFISGYKKSDGTIILNAGKTHGIHSSSQLAIYVANVESSEVNLPIGYLVVNGTSPTISTLVTHDDALSFEIPPYFYAKEIQDGQEMIIRVHCAEREALELNLLSTARLSSFAAAGIVFVDSANSADVCISIQDTQIVFHRVSGVSTSLESWQFRSIAAGDAENFLRVLRAAARFKHHLESTSSSTPNEHQIVMEFHKLQGHWSEDYHWILNPIGPNLIDDNLIDIVVEESAMFGVTIHNNTEFPLYPYLLYFDDSDFGIQAWYVPSFGMVSRTGIRPDSPLPAHSKFTIGYGDGGALPWAFYLRKGEDKDVGFLKLYVTDSPSDFSSILQSSPFDEMEPRQYSESARGSLNPSDVCITKTITVQQRREGTASFALQAKPLERSTSNSRSIMFFLLMLFLLYFPKSTIFSLAAFAFYGIRL
ncbi:hypothetical protein BD410DRAFT_82003 [Rickenella mellea]|uniref:Peptidase C14 caspase domain-containing protein n=1 Tax=Rickenella mellea TaxID=50990 RepID=A0A4Y7PLF0_9AGAM|nr:hypothetical protein BD410DRAFT_82003 [Rickenella mellea]